MSQWTNRFSQHPIQNTLRTLQNLLNEMDPKLFKGRDDAFASYERVRQSFELTKGKLDNSDPNLVPIQSLNNLNSSLQAVTNEISAFKTDKNEARLANANSHIDNVLVHLGGLLSPLGANGIESIKEAATSYRRAVGQFIRNIEEETDTLKTKLANLTNDLSKLSGEINSQKQRTDSIISNFQQQFSSAEDKRRSEFQSAETERKKKSDNLFGQQEAEWNQIIKDKKAEYDDLVDKTSNSLDKLKQDSISRTNDLMSEIEKSKDKAQDLVGIITDTGMVGGYQRVANEERISARNWRRVALWSLIALAAFAVFAFVETLGKEIRWDQFAARIFVATSFGILAAYAALQADKHERAERRNRKTELELASISPYLLDLPEDKQHKIREELALRLFGQMEVVDSKVDKKTTGSVLDLLKMAIETIDTLAKKQ